MFKRLKQQNFRLFVDLDYSKVACIYLDPLLLTRLLLLLTTLVP